MFPSKVCHIIQPNLSHILLKLFFKIQSSWWEKSRLGSFIWIHAKIFLSASSFVDSSLSCEYNLIWLDLKRILLQLEKYTNRCCNIPGQCSLNCLVQNSWEVPKICVINNMYGNLCYINRECCIYTLW